MENDRLLVLQPAHEGGHHGVELADGDVGRTSDVAAYVVCNECHYQMSVRPDMYDYTWCILGVAIRGTSGPAWGLRTVISYVNDGKRGVGSVLLGQNLLGERLGGHAPQTGNRGHGMNE